ncbi:MAG: SGNH/GDSL hydrolase family protein [SAR324 cluster bacterium]|nr:SGNH/GDSL hydrolase family protein [SAR324 cluster bacterium]
MSTKRFFSNRLRSRNIALYCAASGLWLLLFFTVLELAGFLYFRLPFSKPIGGYGYPRELFIARRDLDFAFKPGFDGHFIGGPYKKIPIRINSDGFRDRNFPPKSPLKSRILVLGDSVVFGSGVHQEDRFTEVLSELKKREGKAVEILNLGVNSYSYWHYVKLLESEQIKKLQADFLLIAFTLNDIQPRESAWPKRMLEMQSKQHAVKRWQEKFQFWLDDLYSVHLFKQLRDRLVMYMMTHDEREHYHTKWMRKQRSNWENGVIYQELKTNVKRSLELANDWSIPLAMIILPELNEVKQPQSFGWAREKIYLILEELNIRYCGLSEIFAKKQDLESYFLIEDSLHFSPQGHQLAAQILFDCLKQASWKKAGWP